jgi:transposase
MPRRPAIFDLSHADRLRLERWVRTPTAPQRVVSRSRIVLLLGEGHSGREVAERLGISRHTVDLWRQRFREGGCPLLLRDKPGRGRKRHAPPV